MGEEVAEYKRRFEIKTGDDDKDWKALIALCKALDQTPPDRLEEVLKPILDLDGVLWFLALVERFINGDGFGLAPATTASIATRRAPTSCRTTPTRPSGRR